MNFRGSFLLGMTALALMANWPVGGSTAFSQSTQENQRVTAQLESVLRSRVTNPDGKKITLKILPTNHAGRGEFSHVLVKSSPARVGDLYLSEVALDAHNAKIDVPYLFSKRKVRTQSATTTLRAIITENDLTRMFAEGRSTKSMGITVKFLTGNRLQIAGNLNYPLVNGPVVGIGRLRQLPGSRVNLDIISLKLRGIEAPGFIKDRFSQSLNPIIKYQDLPFSPRFKTFVIRGSKAYLST